jgi:hypothetical protein
MNTQTQEALKMAIEGLEQLLLFLYQEEETALYCNKFYEIQTAKKNIDECNRKINACKEALEAEQVCQAQEPVLITRIACPESNAKQSAQEPAQGIELEWYNKGWTDANWEWQGLTDDEILAIPVGSRLSTARAIEQALKEKNYG